MAGDLRITAAELRPRIEAGEHFTIIDTRNPQAWSEAADIARGAIRFRGDNLNEILPRIPPNDPVIAYCTGPNEASSASLAQTLRERGFHVWALKDGYDAWKLAKKAVMSACVGS